MQTQTEALIEAIENNPGISRSELSDVRTEDGFRIANFTARITDARNLLSKV
jgi:DNA topoisomerase VI subunit A